VAPHIKSENTKKLQRLIHVRQDEAKWFAVLRVLNLRTRSDIIKEASYQMTGSEIKVTENLGSTTFNNTLEIKKQNRSKYLNPFQYTVNVMRVFNNSQPPTHLSPPLTRYIHTL